MTIQKGTIEALRKTMKEAPEVAQEIRKISKQEAIRELRKEIEGMQKRGYTLDDIAKWLTDGGVQITTPTLKSYMQRTKPTKAKPGNKKQPVMGSEKKPPAAKPVTTKTDTKENKGGFAVRPDSEI